MITNYLRYVSFGTEVNSELPVYIWFPVTFKGKYQEIEDIEEYICLIKEKRLNFKEVYIHFHNKYALKPLELLYLVKTRESSQFELESNMEKEIKRHDSSGTLIVSLKELEKFVKILKYGTLEHSL